MAWSCDDYVCVVAFPYTTPRGGHDTDSVAFALSDMSDTPDLFDDNVSEPDTSDDESDLSGDEREDELAVCKADLAYLKGLQRAEHEITTDKELTNFLQSKTAKSHYPATWKQFRSNTVEAQIAKNARELLASVGASHKRAATCALTGHITAQDAEAHLDVTPRYFRHSHEKGFESSAQRLFTVKYPPNTEN